MVFGFGGEIAKLGLPPFVNTSTYIGIVWVFIRLEFFIKDGEMHSSIRIPTRIDLPQVHVVSADLQKLSSSMPVVTCKPNNQKSQTVNDTNGKLNCYNT